MEVILLEKIQNLGGLGDRVTVKPGYARNMLVPQGKALPATDANLAVFESRRADLESAAAAEVKTAEDRAQQLEAISLRVERKANGGRLFGSVTAADVADAIMEAGGTVKRSEVRLAEGPIRQTGQYEVRVRVHPDVDAVVSLVVATEGGEDEDEDDFDADAERREVDELDNETPDTEVAGDTAEEA